MLCYQPATSKRRCEGNPGSSKAEITIHYLCKTATGHGTINTCDDELWDSLCMVGPAAFLVCEDAGINLCHVLCPPLCCLSILLGRCLFCSARGALGFVLGIPHLTLAPHIRSSAPCP